MKSNQKNRLVVLSGAGISAESGIKTFRDNDGLWENYNIEEVATPEAWKKNPELVTRFYNERRKQVMGCQPNKAHFILKDLEKDFDVTIVTQNIDDLHERAGSSKVLHLHGQIRMAKSSGPNSESQYYPIQGDTLTINDKCTEGYVLRPHVVWFGEEVPLMDDAAVLVQNADILLVVGTSLNVYPAAGLASIARQNIPKFIIDPSANSIKVESSFILIPCVASEGMEQIKEILKSDLY